MVKWPVSILFLYIVYKTKMIKVHRDATGRKQRAFLNYLKLLFTLWGLGGGKMPNWRIRRNSQFYTELWEQHQRSLSCPGIKMASHQNLLPHLLIPHLTLHFLPPHYLVSVHTLPPYYLASGNPQASPCSLLTLPQITPPGPSLPSLSHTPNPFIKHISPHTSFPLSLLIDHYNSDNFQFWLGLCQSDLHLSCYFA